LEVALPALYPAKAMVNVPYILARQIDILVERQTRWAPEFAGVAAVSLISKNETMARYLHEVKA
jgi:hypothetical protein